MILRKVAAQGFTQAGRRFQVGQRFHNVTVDWSGGGLYINLSGVSGRLAGVKYGEVHKGSIVAVEITDFEFLPHNGAYHATFRWLKPGEVVSPPPVAKPPVPASNTNPVEAVLQELRSRIEGANTAQALAELASPLRRASSKHSAIQIRPALEQWAAKAGEIVGFYLDAHSVLGWTQEAVRHYEDMSDLVTQLNLLQPKPGKGEPRNWKLPAPPRGNSAKLPLVQWTREQVAAEQGRVAAAEAERAAAEKIRRNPFCDQHNFNELLAACAGSGTADLSEWLKYLTADDSGRTFLQQYPAWKIINSVRPLAIKEVIESFKAVLRGRE